MSLLTRLMKFVFPSENQEPFFETYEEGETQRDYAHYAHSENANLVWTSLATFTWTAATDTLTWSLPISITGMTTGPKFATIAAGSQEIEDGEVIFFVMPRLLLANQAVTLIRAGRVFSVDARLFDLKLFVARVGDVLYFATGQTMLDGDSGPLFAGGISGSGGTITLIQSPNGSITVTNPAGPTTDVATTFGGTGGNFGILNTSARTDHAHAGGTHDHEAQLKIAPGAGVTSLNLNADGAITLKTLLHADIYRNGVLQSEGDHLTINLGLKTASLLFTTVASDRFLINRAAS